ncbi:WSC domain protein [Thozetella sp. PMI_491]|nr:WSC domain protein [Thozetella sp. PMI_491]
MALAAVASPATAFWRLTCDHTVVVERGDPIVNPGKVSGHLHQVLGGANFNLSMTFDDARNSACSTCRVKQDLSNYWTPVLFYKYPNGSVTQVKQSGATIYYLPRTTSGSTDNSTGVLAFPPGFRMLAGNPFLRSYNDVAEQQAISHVCIGGNGGAPRFNGLPNINCPGGVRSQVYFPSCWDGVNLDSSDHKSHVAYPSAYNSGTCPSTHPKRLVSLFFEILWSTQSFSNMWYGDSQPFVFAMGDPTGYGFHGDFLNGWDVDVLQQAVTNCLDPSGVIDKCPYFDFYDATTIGDCYSPSWVNEDTASSNALPALPGCNPITYGPANAIPAAANSCGATTTAGPPQVPYNDYTASGWAYVGCAKDQVVAKVRTLPNQFTNKTVSATTMTNDLCMSGCASKGYAYAGTEYGGECWCGDSVSDDAAPIPGILGACVTPCKGDATQTCGGKSRLSVYRKCAAGENCLNVQLPTVPN